MNPTTDARTVRLVRDVPAPPERVCRRPLARMPATRPPGSICPEGDEHGVLGGRPVARPARGTDLAHGRRAVLGDGNIGVHVAHA